MKKALRASTAFSLAGLLTISSLMGPVAAAYAASNVPSADAAVDAATADDDGEASRDAGSVDVDAADDSSPATNVDESADEDFGVDVSENHQQAEPVDSSFQYVYLAYPSLSSGTDQVVAFATPDDGDSLASATLNYVSANGVQGTIEASATADNSAAFIFGSQLESNTYFLTSITYALQGDGSEHEVDLSDRDYSFTVINGSVSSEGTSVYYADGDGNAVEAQSIQQALECADSPDGISTYAERSARNVGVIALDAGHGGVDSGAQGNGKSEADLTWKIMTACKNKLEAYGFKIVLAREQSGYYPSNDYLYRVQRCIDQGAQAFVSFHINSGSSGAHGAEVYAPTANGTDYTQVSVELANKVMNNLAAMGLTYRGVFQMEVGDEFAVIRCAREQGIPGILIEHGFISNYGDVANYFSDDGCRRLGEADAAAIIAQFPHPYSVNGISFSEELGHAGSTVKIGVNVSGKTDGLRYKFVWHRAGSDWSDSNWGVIGQDLTSPSISWTLPQAGEYEIYADVIDSNGYVTSTSKYKVVNWSLESLEVSGSALCGKPVKLQAKVSGDASGLKYKFVWEKGGWAHDDDHYTTAYDMAKITQYALKNKKFVEVFDRYQYTSSDGQHQWVKKVIYKSKRDHIDTSMIEGCKSGYTSKAQSTLSSLLNINDHHYVCVVGFSKNSDGYNHCTVNDTLALGNYVKDHYSVANIIKKDTKMNSVKIKNGQTNKVDVITEKDIEAVLPNNYNPSDIKYKYHLKDLTAPVKKDQKAGTMDVYYRDTKLETISLNTTQAVHESGSVVFMRKMKNVVLPCVMAVVIILVVLLLVRKIMIKQRRKKRRQQRNRKK